MTGAADISVRQAPAGLLWLITGCWMLQPLSTDLYLASLPHLSAYFQVSPATVQQTLSLFVLGLAGAQLISGPLSDRFGRRPVLLAGAAIYVLASAACTIAPSIEALIVARFVQALGACTAGVIARAVVRDAYSTAEGVHIIARTTSMLSVAILLSPIVGAHIQAHLGWRAVFFVLSTIGLLLATGAFLRFAETNHRPDPAATQPLGLARNYLGLLKNPRFLAYALPGAFSYGSAFVFISGASFALIQVLGVPTEYFGYCFSLGVLGYAAGTSVCRRLLHRLGVSGALRLGSSLSLAAGLVFAAAVALGLHHWATVVVAQFFVTFAHGINSPCTQSGAVAPFAEKAGTAAGLLGCLTMVTAFAMSTLVGVSHDGTLYPLALLSVTTAVALFTSERLLARHRAD